MSKAKRGEPAKSNASPRIQYFRMSIPLTDEGTLAWLKKQYNASFSLRTLVHRDIEANGLTDVHNRIKVPNLEGLEGGDDSVG